MLKEDFQLGQGIIAVDFHIGDDIDGFFLVDDGSGHEPEIECISKHAGESGRLARGLCARAFPGSSPLRQGFSRVAGHGTSCQSSTVGGERGGGQIE